MDKQDGTVTNSAPDAGQEQPLSTALRHGTIANQCLAHLQSFKIHNIGGLAPDDIISMAADLDAIGVSNGHQ